MIKALVRPGISLMVGADSMNYTRGAVQSGVTAIYTNRVQDPALLEECIRSKEVAGTFDIMTAEVLSSAANFRGRSHHYV